jgi:hypothetical protein
MTDTRLLMTIRPSTPKSSTLHVLEDAYFKVSINRQEHFLHIIRSETSLCPVPTRRGWLTTKLVECGGSVSALFGDGRSAQSQGQYSTTTIELVIREVWFPTMMQLTSAGGDCRDGSGAAPRRADVSRARLQREDLPKRARSAAVSRLAVADPAVAASGLPGLSQVRLGETGRSAL